MEEKFVTIEVNPETKKKIPNPKTKASPIQLKDLPDKATSQKTKIKEIARKPITLNLSTLAACIILTIFLSVILSAALGRSLGFDHRNTNRAYSNLSAIDSSKGSSSLLSVQEIIAKNADAVVEIAVESATQDFFGQVQLVEGAGSGVIVNANGYIATNHHVINGARNIKVTLHNGKTYTATAIGSDPDNDIAVIKINAENLTFANIGDSDVLAVGDLAVAIGNPLGQLGGTATSGIISALDRRLTIDGTTLSLLQTDAAINGGNSGGGLFNGAGELIGIVDAKSEGVGIEGLAFAIPINSVAGIIDSLIKTGRVSTKPAIGITIYEVSKDNSDYYTSLEPGVYIKEITSEEAKKAGLKSGDRIVSINGKNIKSSSDLIARVRENKIGDIITLIIERDEQEISVKVKLTETTSTK